MSRLLDPVILMDPDRIAEMAAEFDVDKTRLMKTVCYAADRYQYARSWREDGESDSLDEFYKPIEQLLGLLSSEINLRRLFFLLWFQNFEASGYNWKIPRRRKRGNQKDDDPDADKLAEKGVEDYDPDADRLAIANLLQSELPAVLERIRDAARELHWKRGRGNPGTQMDLRRAYDILADEWRRLKGDENFTKDWYRGAPVSLTARFLFDAMKLIDPDRAKLSAELEGLMDKTVRSLPGPRRGRKPAKKKTPAGESRQR